MTKIKDVAMVKFQSLSIDVRTTTKISQMVTEIFYAIDKWFPLGRLRHMGAPLLLFVINQQLIF